MSQRALEPALLYQFDQMFTLSEQQSWLKRRLLRG